MCRSSPPPVTNPITASAASQAGNVGTAVAQGILGNANTYTPYGQTIYNQIGTEQIKDAAGNMIDVPRYESRTTLAPAQQAILDQQNDARLGLTQLAGSQIDRLGNVLGAPVSLANLPKGGTLPKTGPEFEQLRNMPRLARLTGAGLPIQMGVNLKETPGNFASSGPLDRSLNLGNAATGFASTGAVDQTVGPQDWSADRLRVEQAIRNRANPQLEQRGRALDAQLEAQGFRRGTAAFEAARDEHNRSLNDFELATIRAGGDEQSRLANLDFTQFGLEGQANQRAYDQAHGRGAFARDSILQNNAAQTTAAQFFNQAQQQDYTQDLGRGVFGQQATAQNNAARLAAGNFANQAQAGAFGQRGQMVGANNAAAQQAAQNNWNRTMYGNQNAQQAYGNENQLAILMNQFRQGALAESLVPRDRAVNEVGALLGTGQVTPTQMPTYQAGQVAPTNVGANMFAADALRNQQWQQEQQGQNAMLGGLFGLAGTGIMGGMRYGFPTFGMTG